MYQYLKNYPTIRFIGIILIFFSIAAAQNDKWIVEDVTFTGNNAISEDKLIEQMQIQPSCFFRKVEFSLTTLINDIAALETFYRSIGYLNANISIENLSRDSSCRNIKIQLVIEEGSLITIDTIIFTGNIFYSDSQLANFIELKSGSPFDSSAYESASGTIKDSLASTGYMFAEVNKSFKLDTNAITVNIFYNIKEGPVVYAGTLEYQGLDKVSEVVIQRELSFLENDKITSEKIRISTERIYSTGLFDIVRIEPVDTITITGDYDSVVVPVMILVQESDMFQISAGGGYEYDDGLFVSLRLMYRSLFSLGHKISTSGQVSFDNISTRLIYNYPWFLKLPLFADFMGYIERRNEEAFEGLFYGGFIALSSRTSEGNTYRSWLRIERVNWMKEPPTDNEFSHKPARNTILLGFGFSRDTRQNIYKPEPGFFMSISTELAGLGFKWSNNFFKADFDLRGYLVSIGDQFNLSSAIYSGYVNGFGIDRGIVPPQELLRAGENSVRPVRGYQQQEVTPSVNGEAIGGHFALIINIIEFPFPIYRWFYGALFLDAGNIWLGIDDFSLNELKWAIGPGLRLNLSSLLARIDYGIKLDNIWDLDGRFHISIGLPF